MTKVQSQSVFIDLAHDQGGNIKSDKRTIVTRVHTTAYEYDASDRIFEVNYPTGRRPSRHHRADTRPRRIDHATVMCGRDSRVTAVS